ncbi:unnamed protein product, partial [Closterium sp. Naga37s-1]
MSDDVLQVRQGGEYHSNNPEMSKLLHKAVRQGEQTAYSAYQAHLATRPVNVLRDLLELDTASRSAIPLEEVESAASIATRFCTGGMSLGAISRECHEVIAVAMNRLGGKSNSGEGGEDPMRWVELEDVDADGRSPTFPHLKGLRNGDKATSAIKQVASGRFGVTPTFLANAEQLEIKVAQGAKPGEGGQLPGKKVSPYIAQLRSSKPGVPLISPPPHHDIYSIEDLAQLIFDLHQVNPAAKVSVKLVAEAGIGTVASGVAKANADIIQISGHDGGTGASPISSIKHAGGPWEMGLTETHQTLLANGLRDRVVLRVDGGIKCGTDVLVAAAMGADEFGFGSLAMIATGCIMARICHTNNCPVGVASQREELRARFPGVPSDLVNYFVFVAEEVRVGLASLGMKSLDELVGRVNALKARDVALAKTNSIDLSYLLTVCCFPSPLHARLPPLHTLRHARPSSRLTAWACPLRIDTCVHTCHRFPLSLPRCHIATYYPGVSEQSSFERMAQEVHSSMPQCSQTPLFPPPPPPIPPPPLPIPLLSPHVPVPRGVIGEQQGAHGTGGDGGDRAEQGGAAGHAHSQHGPAFPASLSPSLPCPPCSPCPPMCPPHCNEQVMAAIEQNKVVQLATPIVNTDLPSLLPSPLRFPARPAPLAPPCAVMAAIEQNKVVQLATPIVNTDLASLLPSPLLHVPPICQQAGDGGDRAEQGGAAGHAHSQHGPGLPAPLAPATCPPHMPTSRFKGSAGQSFGCFLAGGMNIRLIGEANDYVGKGMAGGQIVVVPSKAATFQAETATIIGNTCLYGATGGRLFVRGCAGERFAVRNSNAQAVLEGAGDHCCEYMTGGTVVALGKVGRNVAAGMTGGIGYFLDEDDTFSPKVNREIVAMQRVVSPGGQQQLKSLIQDHADLTGSAKAAAILAEWDKFLPLFWQLVPPSEANSPEAKAPAAEEPNQFVPGHLVALLQMVVRADVDLAIRQVAAIHFKNTVSRNWRTKSDATEAAAAGSPLFSDGDVAAVRDNLVEAVICCPPLIRSQLIEVLKAVVQSDYPDRMPALLQQALANLHSPDQPRVYGALVVVRVLARKYEFKDEEDRVPVHEVVTSTFPQLLVILQQLLAVPNPSLDIAEYIKLVLKIFWSACYLKVPEMVQQEAVFLAWMECFHALLERPVPAEGQPSDPEQRKQWAWWKVKKWLLHIINRMFHRFGNPKYAKGDDKAFATMFADKCAACLLNSYLHLLAPVRTDPNSLPDRITNLAMQYVTYSLSKKALYESLKPHLQVLQFEVAFPLLCFNDHDALLWADNPLEYVRKGYDIIEDMYSARTAALNFLAELVTKRSKDTLDPFIAALVLILNRYNEAPPDQKAAQARQKDGALLAIGALHEKLQGTARYKAQLEHMLLTHVFPEFTSPCAFLRAKAAWVAGQYADIPFSNPAHFGGALQAVVALLRDPELPVRVDAVVALRSFVDACEDLDQLRPIIPNLLDDFFKLMHEVENEDLVFTLEVIVEKFGEEMSPFAVGLIHNLAAAFWKCVRSSEAAENEESEEAVDDMSALAAAGCLRAMGTVLESISSLPHLFPQLEPTLLPILHKMLTSDGQDLYEEVLEIATYMTYYSPSISPALWSIWPLILSSLNEFAIDFFEYALDPLDNFISRGTEHFLTCPDPNYPDSLWKLLSKLLSDDDISDRDVVPAPKLMEVVLLNCRGRVDAWLPLYLQLALTRLNKASLRHLKDLLMQVVSNSLYYNAQLTLQALEGMGATAGVFQTWLTMLQAKSQTTSKRLHFKRQHDKKVCILSLVSLLSLPTAALGALRFLQRLSFLTYTPFPPLPPSPTPHHHRQHDKKVCILGLVSLLSLPTAALPASVAPLQGEFAKAVLQLLVAYKEQHE